MSKKNKRRFLGNKIVNRMPKVSEINLGTEIVGNPIRPECVEDDMEPIQCINGHWTTTGDLDEGKCCSQCPVEVERDELDTAEDEMSDVLDSLDKDEDYYDDGMDYDEMGRTNE